MATAKVAGVLLCCTAALIFPVLSSGQRPIEIQTFSKAVNGLSSVFEGVDLQVQNASPEIKAKLGDLAQPTPEPKPQIELANETDRVALNSRVAAFADHAESEAQGYSQLALAAIIVSAAFALIGSIASFLSKNKTAGIIGLVVASIVGISNAYPVGALAAFYLQLAGEARALKVDCELLKPYTVNAYNSDVNQFKLLYVYEDKRPSFGSPRLATDELTKELQAVRTASSNVTIAQK